MWVYSGRRGVHCWVADERARKLTAEGRKAVVSYLEVVKGGDAQQRKVNLPIGKGNLHPSLIKSQTILEQYFAKTLLKNQDILGAPERWEKMLQLVPDDEVKEALSVYLKKNVDKPALEKWKAIAKELTNNNGKKRNAVAGALRDIVFQYAYPRLDDHVSTGVNHLLKSPFCVHPKTGRVCVPIDPNQCDEFNPLTVPTLTQLIQELDNIDVSNVDEEMDTKLEWYERTSLKPYIDMFRTFLAGLDESIKEQARLKRAEEEKKLMF